MHTQMDACLVLLLPFAGRWFCFRVLEARLNDGSAEVIYKDKKWYNTLHGATFDAEF